MENYTSPELLIIQKEFLNNFKETEMASSFYTFIDSLPLAVAVLTPDRKVIFSNSSLLKKYGYTSVEQVLGKRPGEMLNCVHSLLSNNQCEMSNNCKVCGTLAALKKTIVTLKPNISEMHLTVVNDGSLVSYDLKISVTPLFISEKLYLLLYLEDISQEKRKKAIERIFFHDILNKVSMLNGLYELMLKHPSQEHAEHLDLMGIVLSDMTDEIASQRQLAAAENGELFVKMEPVLVCKLLQQVIRQVEQLITTIDVKIEFESLVAEIEIMSNATLLNRIVTNLLKNAVEASLPKEKINLKLQVKDHNIILSVHNNSYMEDEVQLQVFMRSFSTKGENRGLGTYSVKLLTERYLSGKVWFTSDASDGTTFNLELPMDNP